MDYDYERNNTGNSTCDDDLVCNETEIYEFCTDPYVGHNGDQRCYVGLFIYRHYPLFMTPIGLLGNTASLLTIRYSAVITD